LEADRHVSVQDGRLLGPVPGCVPVRDADSPALKSASTPLGRRRPAPRSVVAPVPRRSRGTLGRTQLVAAFLAAFALWGLLGLEVWSLTGWRLFAGTYRSVQAADRTQPVGRGAWPVGPAVEGRSVDSAGVAVLGSGSG
jgi:hypothetical protein